MYRARQAVFPKRLPATLDELADALENTPFVRDHYGRVPSIAGGEPEPFYQKMLKSRSGNSTVLVFGSRQMCHYLLRNAKRVKLDATFKVS